MKTVVKNLTALHNPVSLAGVGGLAVVRGTGFIATGTGTLLLNGYNSAPSLPGVGVTAVGAVWVFVGLFLWLGMVWRRVFITAVALMGGMYATWVVVHAMDLLTNPDWDSITGLMVYTVMVPVTLTLAAIEVAPPAEPSTGAD